jgi:hypothetical protein
MQDGARLRKSTYTRASVVSIVSQAQALIYNLRVEAIRELFRGNIDAAEAAKRLTEDVNASRNTDQAEGQLWGMWQLVADVSAKFPAYHEKLVDVVNIIHTFPDQTLHDPGAVVKWSDLPILGPTWAETVFNCACSYHLISSAYHAFLFVIFTSSRERGRWRSVVGRAHQSYCLHRKIERTWHSWS